MNKSNINELSAETEADSNSKAKNQQVSQPNANTNVGSSQSFNKSEAGKYYEKSKHQDDWGVDVVYPYSVENIIELSKYEGILLGLKICKEMFAQGQISHDNIYENEIYYRELLQNKMDELMLDT